jgi:hypothetical protein
MFCCLSGTCLPAACLFVACLPFACLPIACLPRCIACLPTGITCLPTKSACLPSLSPFRLPAYACSIPTRGCLPPDALLLCECLCPLSVCPFFFSLSHAGHPLMLLGLYLNVYHLCMHLPPARYTPATHLPACLPSCLPVTLLLSNCHLSVHNCFTADFLPLSLPPV